MSDKIIIEDKPRSAVSQWFHKIGFLVLFWIFINLFAFGWIAFFQTADVSIVQYKNISSETIHEFENLAEVPEGLERFSVYGEFVEDGKMGYIKYYDDAGDIAKVPYSSFSGMGWFFMVIINLIFLMIYSQKDDDSLGIKGQQAVNIVRDFLETTRLKENATWTYDIGPVGDRNLKKKMMGEKVASLHWVIPVTFWMDAEKTHPEFRILRVDFKTGDIIKILPTKFQFSQKDTCPECGTECDFKLETTEDLKKSMELFKGLKK